MNNRDKLLTKIRNWVYVIYHSHTPEKWQSPLIAFNSQEEAKEFINKYGIDPQNRTIKRIRNTKKNLYFYGE